MQHVRVWSALVVLTSLAAALSVVGARSAGALADLPRLLATPTPSSAADLCVALAGAGAVLAGAWLGLVTAVAALDHLQRRAPRRSSALRPRLVRTLVGASLTCLVAQPAVAAEPVRSDHAPPLPVRPVSTGEDVVPTRVTAPPPARAAAATVRVRPGDALWTIAARLTPRRADPAVIDRAWRQIYAANRQRVGADPDLLHPGTVLVVPDLGPAAAIDTRPARSRLP